MTSHYSRLDPEHEIPLSEISRPSSSSNVKKFQPRYTGTFSSIASAPQFVKRTCFAAINGWWLELGSVLLAFCVMLVTLVLLAHYNGKAIADTPRKPSLNTLVNIFSTIEASLLVFVVAEILSQAKWLRMQRQSRLDDFNTIDNASRGLRGAVQILFRPRLGIMALVGALTTILALLIGPMLQETVGLKSVSLPADDRNATAPVSRFFAPLSNPALPQMDMGMKGTILNGLSLKNSSSLDPLFGCPSGNCTFDQPYTSLGISHSCTRLPVDRKCDAQNVCNYTLPNGHRLINSGGPVEFNAVNVSTVYNTTGRMMEPTEELQDQWGIMRVSIISLTNGPLCRINGTNPECVLDNRNASTQAKLFDGGVIGMFCDMALSANTYTAAVVNSRLEEKLINSTDARDLRAQHYQFEGTPDITFNASNPVTNPDPVIVPDRCWIGKERYDIEDFKNSNNASWTYVELEQTVGDGNQTIANTPAKIPLDCVFAMRSVVYASFRFFMTNNPGFLDGYGSAQANNGVAGGLYSFYPNVPDSALVYFPANQAAIGVDPIFNNGNASFESIDAAFDRLATAMTTYMRDNSGHPADADYTGIEAQLSAQRPSAQGVLFRTQTVVVVQFYWVILPLVVLFTVIIYLIAAIVQGGVKDLDGNTQAHLWKSSAIVPLIIGHRSQLSGSTPALEGHRDMQALKKRHVKLVGSKGGWIFVDSDQRAPG